VVYLYAMGSRKGEARVDAWRRDRFLARAKKKVAANAAAANAASPGGEGFTPSRENAEPKALLDQEPKNTETTEEDPAVPDPPTEPPPETPTEPPPEPPTEPPAA
jgi:hypothetical protein